MNQKKSFFEFFYYHYIKIFEICYNINNIQQNRVAKMLLLFLLILVMHRNPIQASENYIDKYTAPDGFEVISHTEQWQGDELSEIYQELLKNTHGEEYPFLTTIELYGGSSPDGLEEGLYSYTIKKWDYLLGTSVKLDKGSTISLYNMDEKDHVWQVARVLSHEYGHHFTIYYLAKNDSEFFLDWTKSKFYSARQAKDFSKMSDAPSTDHAWTIAEICAEDYVQLYGSPTAKTWVEVYDIKDRMTKGLLQDNLSYSSQVYNILPQENPFIPLAWELEQQTKYWENITGIPPSLQVYSKPELSLGERTLLQDGYVSQTIEWTSSLNQSGEEAQGYTLVALNRKTNQFLPIKSVKSGDEKRAMVGSVLVRNGSDQRIYTDSFVQQLGKDGFDDLRVFAFGQRGEAISSESYTLDFSAGTLSQSSKTSTVVTIPVTEQDDRWNSRVMAVLDWFMDRFFSFIEFLFDKFAVQ